MTLGKIQIQRSHQDQVVHLVLNSPKNLNALDLDMALDFRRATEALAGDKSCRAVIIRANGTSFSAGGDLAMLRRKSENSVSVNRREMLYFYQSFLGLRNLSLPLICVVHGHVVGAGFCFAAACDLRIAADDVKFSASFTKLALHPGMGGSYFLPSCFGPTLAKELILTGRRMGAEEALQCGFLSRVSPASDLESEWNRLVEQILANAPKATKAYLKSERNRQQAQLQAVLEEEAFEQSLCYTRPEFLTAIDALISSTKPQE